MPTGIRGTGTLLKEAGVSSDAWDTLRHVLVQMAAEARKGTRQGNRKECWMKTNVMGRGMAGMVGMVIAVLSI